MQEIFRKGLYHTKVERVIRLYREGVGSLGYLAEQLDLPKRELIQGMRHRVDMLAEERGATFLIDEEEGRSVACTRGLTVRGTLGVLIEAYRADLIDSVQLRFYFTKIERRTDIWICPALCHRLLKETLGNE